MPEIDYEKLFLHEDANKPGNMRFTIEDGNGFSMPLKAFYDTYIKGKICSTSFRRRMYAGQSVADALQYKAIATAKHVERKSVANAPEYLTKHLNKYGNTVLSAKRCSMDELKELLNSLGYNEVDIHVRIDPDATAEEAREYYVIQRLDK